MKQLLSTNNIADLAFAQALLQGEGIAVFEMDVNMSVLEGGIGIFPRRLMVAEEDYTAAARTLRDNGLEPYEHP
ncbi:putative signal transducing protein [Lentibacter sp.]|uniref:putative signal transducing protein n=1 Tax=Lentibacter sp. TaxID=2024994 RepID=UPI003F6CB8A9